MKQMPFPVFHLKSGSETNYQSYHNGFRDAWKIAFESIPNIVCLCGSTRFYHQFQKSNFEETMKGNIVLSVGFFANADPKDFLMKSEHGEDIGITPEQKEMLDELHKRKIDLADEILVLNVGGYIGKSTASEINYAKIKAKKIRYLEPIVD